MILPNQKDAMHKAWLFRLLTAIYDNQLLSSALYFKGGTCSAMLGFLDRFSVDLDFDYVANMSELKEVKQNLEKTFEKLGLVVKDQSQKIPQYFLKYPSSEKTRNTIKIDITFPVPKSNEYKSYRLNDIDRIITCQTIETMFANKLVALIERYERNGSIAGRDLYDIHYFFLQGFTYNPEVIIERRKKEVKSFLKNLVKFIENKITQNIINQDLNFLLDPKKFQQIRKILKPEALMFLKDEIERLKNTAEVV